MNYFKSIILLIFILKYIKLASTSSTNIYCDKNIENCLSCQKDKCLLCDIFNGYIYISIDNQTNCQKCKNGIKNCLFSNDCNNCLVCNQGYTVCQNKCIKNIPNCSEGNVCQNECTICSPKFYLNQGYCYAVKIEIKNCLVYQSSTSCLRCYSGYEVILNEKVEQECAFIDKNFNLLDTQNNNTNDSCIAYLGKTFSCNSCVNGKQYGFYNFNINGPYKYLQNKFLNNDNLNNLISKLNLGNIDRNQICEHKLIEGCLIIDRNGSFKCISCESNYYISNGKCVKYTENPISNCINYSINRSTIEKSIICTKCENEYYLNDKKYCIKIDNIIKGCINYNSERTQCTICDEPNGYLLTNNTCRKLNNFQKVNNCWNYNTSGQNEGKCQSCDGNNFILSNNFCISLTNCSIPMLNQQNQKIVCQTCNPGFKLNENRCIPLDTSLNCQININQNSNDCSVCKPSYFPVNGICTNKRNNINFISNCDEGTNNFVCQKCLRNYIKVERIYESFPVIYNCLYYSNINGNCLLCNNNNVPSSNGLFCTESSSFNNNNCSIYDGSICRSCKNMFYNITDNSCNLKDINNSEDLCKENYPTGININRINTSDLSIRDNNTILYTPYNCTKCLSSNLLIDTNNKLRCIPRLSLFSNNPYKDYCNSMQIRVRYVNPGNKILTCRNINDIVGNLYKNDINCYIYINHL